jgi:hypothetical protein
MLFIQITVTISLLVLALSIAAEAGRWIGARIADRHIDLGE